MSWRSTVRVVVTCVLIDAAWNGHVFPQEPERGEIGIQVGFFVPDADLSGKDEILSNAEALSGLRTGLFFAPRWGWFFDAAFADINTTFGPDDANVLTARSGVEWFSRPDVAAPQWFVGLGLGITEIDFEASSGFTRSLVSISVGQRLRLGPRARMRWELRGDVTTGDSGLAGRDLHEVRLLLALTRGVGRRLPDPASRGDRRRIPETAPGDSNAASPIGASWPGVPGCDAKPHGGPFTEQLTDLIEFAPATEVAHHGLYDVSLNARGLNRSLNRRVSVTLDGRDLAEPFFGSPEWSALAMRIDDVERLEWTPGPVSSRHGPHGGGGALEIRSRAPEGSGEGAARVAVGERGTRNVELVWSGAPAERWRMRVGAGRRQSDGFAASRSERTDYAVPCTAGSLPESDCLALEAVALAGDPIEVVFGNVRLDRVFADSRLLTVEGGATHVSDAVIRTDIGRILLEQVERPWIRGSYTTRRWRMAALYDRRDAGRQRALKSGAALALESATVQLDLETRWDCLDDTAEMTLWARHSQHELDSLGPTIVDGARAVAASLAGSRQTLLRRPLDTDRQSLGGDFAWSVSERMRLGIAGRWDHDSIYDTRFSPRAALLLDLVPNRHELEIVAGRAYRSPSLAEYFLRAELAPAIDLTTLTDSAGAPLNGYCSPDCGLGSAPSLALGNRSLAVEAIRSYEVGYRGRWRDRVELGVRWHAATHDRPIVGLIPQIDAALGRVNPAFVQWIGTAQAESNLTADGVSVADELRAQLPGLSLDVDGSTILAAASYTNLGRADSRGIDAELGLCLGRAWSLSAGYSWLDHEIRDVPAGLADQLLPNAPDSGFVLALAYERGALSGTLGGRRSDRFRWADGLTMGDVPSSTTLDLAAVYRVSDHWIVGARVDNLFDDEHWESFGGDLLRRRALAELTYTWD